LLAEAGLSPLEALRFATVHAARLLGWGENASRLVRGSFADTANCLTLLPSCEHGKHRSI
jgi:imidazolonepropionase-like amidohydrolase